tara:strand:- start:356 stop:1225 length:870 start_codon:yes stop_codon:yes gene_type:complete
MAILWTDSDLTQPLVDGPRRWQRPFDDIFSQLTFEQDYQQFEADFVPANLDSPSSDYSDAYLVREGELTALGGGVVKWTRTYSRIPVSRQTFEGYSWLVPGIGTGAVFAAQTINSAANAAGVTTLTCAGSTTASVNDSLSISYTFTDGVTGTQYGRTVIRTMTGGTGTAPSVVLISEPGGTISYNTAKKITPGRPAEALEVGSSLQLDYYLPGVSAGIGTPFDIPIISELQIYDGDGVKVNSFAADTAPTLTTWRAQVAARDNVCVVSSVVRRWKGNIYERATRYCIAR